MPEFSQFTIAKSGFVTKKYEIFDSWKLKYTAKQLWFNKGIHLYDASGKEVIFIKRPTFFFKLKFQLLHEGAIVATVERGKNWLKQDLIVTTPMQEFKIEGKNFKKEFTIISEGKEVGKVSRKPMKPSKYMGVAFEAQLDPDLMIGMVMSIELMINVMKSRNNG